MFLSIKPITTQDKNYTLAKEIYTSSFPKEERRDVKDWEKLIDENSIFSLNIIQKNNSVLGIITLWDFTSFLYIEHFAIKKEFQNNGFGKQILEKISKNFLKPIILEIEIPNNDLSKRRLQFYKRNGFDEYPEKYIQPSYRNDNCRIEMILMHKKEFPFATAKETIYQQVYNLTT